MGRERERERGGGEKREEIGFKMRVKVGERFSSADMRLKTVPHKGGCNRRRSVADGRQLSASDG